MSALRLIFDNDARLLAQRLAQLLAGGDEPLASDVLVVGSYGVGRWLQQQVADQQGVACLLQLDMPAGFLWRLIAQMLDNVPANSPFDPQSVRWLVYAELSRLAEDSSIEPQRLAPLHARLRDSRGNERMMLSRSIATCFNELLAFRRDWLDAWARGEPSGLSVQVSAKGRAAALSNEAWLAWLWRQVLAQMPAVPSRHPFDRFAHWLRASAPGTLRDAFAQTGVRSITVFGVPELAPEQIELFGLIGSFIPVNFLVNDPCREFWQDIVSAKQVAAIRASQPDVAWLYESEPAVLGAWGRAHRDYLTQLRGLEEKLSAVVPVQIEESFRERELLPPAGRLQALQQNLLLLDPQPWQQLNPTAVDYTLQIHSCHGALRQLQVLRDRLLHAFALLPDLHADQVLVLAPQIDSWAPLIDGVFGDGTIPYSIEGRRNNSDALHVALADLLAAAQTQPGYATIAALLANPALALAMQIDDDERQRLLGWLDRAGFRGGDGKHGWQAALDRLWFGAAVARGPGQAPVFAGDTMAIAGASPANMSSLGKLARLFGSVQRLAAASGRPQPLSDWCALLARESEQWFAAITVAGSAARSESRLTELQLRESRLRLHDALAVLTETQAQALSFDTTPLNVRRLTFLDIDLVTFTRLFDEAASPQPAQIRLGNGVTFAPIHEMRAVPARVIALIGLSESVFPAARSALDFDLIAQAPRFGDQIRGNNDRAAFLDALGAAGDMLIMTYDGRELRSNEVLNPSAVISECLAYVSRQKNQQQFAVIEQPLMAFNPLAFQRSDWPSYDRSAFTAARALARRTAEVATGEESNDASGSAAAPSAFIAPGAFVKPPSLDLSAAQPATAASDQPVVRDQAQWVRRLAQPARAFMRGDLRLNLPYSTAPVADHEPVDVQDDLSAHRKRQIQQTLDASLVPQQWRQWLAARPSDPALPTGASALFAGALLDQKSELMRAKAIKDLRLDAIPATLQVQTVHWHGIALNTGWLDVERTLAVDRVLQFVWSAWSEGAHSALNVWLCHAAAQLWAGDCPVQTIWVQDKGSLQLSSSASSSGPSPPLQQRLQSLLADTAVLSSQPTMLFPKTCYALHREQRKPRKAGTAPAADDGDDDAGQSDAEQSDADQSDERGEALASDAVQGAFAQELSDPWVAALFRDGPPDLARVLRDSDGVYGDLFAQFVSLKSAVKS